MKLRDLINVMDDDTVICVCDDMGRITETMPLKNIGVKGLMNELPRTIGRIYFDKEDGSITIELED